ncbi:hypothetical protein M9Y10_016208 [Tritrichomonas musculus]|uniref:Protein kinase domain-containing protein n=1 Tax=Tritrichomonas musculus TaxID=1915356 RepID=A0ABR2I8B8_9EUKA
MSSNLTIISDYIFNGCYSLSEIIIPSSVTSIGQYSFSECSSLNNISIPSSVSIIKKGAFSWCSSLKQITLFPSIKSIEDYLFAGCSSLENIVIPSSVTSIGKHSFCGCSSLKEISIPSSLTSIPSFIFSWCNSLTKISIPSSVKSIGNYAFFSCKSLVDIEIPFSINEVGIGAFHDCISLSALPDLTEKDDLASSSLNIDDYRIEELISTKYIYTFKGINKKTGEELIIKSYHVTLFKSLVDFIKMAECLQINIPGFVNIQNYRFPVSDRIAIKVGNSEFDFSCYVTISKYIKNGNISSITKEYLKSKGLKCKLLNPTIRSKIFFGVAAIMKKLHDRSIIHRDLRMSKILLGDSLEPMILPSRYTLIVTDLKELEQMLFTSYNMAPDMHVNDKGDQNYGFPVDVYSYEFLLYEMFSPEIKLNINRDKYRHFIDMGRRPLRPSNVPDHYWELIQAC